MGKVQVIIKNKPRMEKVWIYVRKLARILDLNTIVLPSKDKTISYDGI